MTTSQPPIAENGAAQTTGRKTDRTTQRVLVWGGIAAVSAIATFAVLRMTMRRAVVDPTSERIQSLIDEANRLLRALDDQKHG